MQIKNGKILGEYRTDAAGRIYLENIDPELYVITEVKAPDGYILLTGSKEALVEWGKTTTLQFENQPRNPILVKKVDTKTGEPLAGAKFRVEKSNDERMGDFVTNSAGFFVAPDLEAGTYTVYETAAPAGYILDKTPQTAVLKSDGTTTLEFSNKPLACLQIKKVDAVSGPPMKGVEFKITKLNSEPAGPYVTDDAGLIFVPNMKEGWYVVTKTRTLDGYRLDNASRNVEVASDKLNLVEYRNQPYPHLQLVKIDAKTKVPLFGAVFNLYNLKGNLLGEYTTDNRGIIEFPKEVQAGKYKLKEVKAPAGYVLDEMPKTIEVKAGETLELEVPNKPMRGQIQIVKTAAENNPITRDKTGALLEGAVFEIYNTRLEVVDRITTDSRGLAVSKELPMGVYGIKEIAAPKYYFTDGTVFYAELKVNGDLVRFEVKNKPKDISVTIEKRGNVQAMPGDAR